MPTKTANELQDKKYTFVMTDYEVKTIALYVGLSDDDADDITAAIVEVGDGDYNEVWLSTWSAPYELDALYHTPEFWKE